ncbi:tudor and KH domain containing protein TDRD2/TDRKH [Oopsacas minuta]|uniref:Tudor and KH domain containing protein TDRD2/TDRKH n=1 Tax=Oopsacas minuta TaxID=111878 RepID=A0AAV7JUK0_9METZ|nr:tudor and KH domain containing protein TDRD2/TDRKH [Oopsacas minuta]
MYRWLRISLITVATIIPISMVIFLTKRLFSQSDTNDRITHTSTRTDSRNTNQTSRNSPQIIHNYNANVVEFNIDQRNIGFIIGKGGEKIKRIQNEANVRINFRDRVIMPTSPESPANNFDRIAVISGRPECTQLAKSMIEKMLQEKFSDERAMEVRIQIPDWICGRVIGHRGQNIRSMQASSGARIVIENPPSNVQPRQLRNCTISGSPDQIRTANELIEYIVERETKARAQRSASSSFYGKSRNISASSYLSSPTRDRSNRMHYLTNSDLRTDIDPLDSPIKTTPFKKLISLEQRVYLMYFCQQVQTHLQTLPLNQEFFTAYVSTVDRNAFIWIQLLDNIAMELQNLIDKMTLYYAELSLENTTEFTDIAMRTDNLPAFDTESVDESVDIAIADKRKLSLETTNSSPDTSEREQIQLQTNYDTICDSDNSTGSYSESPSELIECAITPNKSSITISNFHPGMLVAAPYIDDDKYYRAIIDKLDENSAHIYFVDFGDYDICKLSLLHNLKEEFKFLPFQAILCQLNDIEVGPNGLSEKAFDRLQELTYCAQWKRICVLPSKNTDQHIHDSCIRQCPRVTLIDTNSEHDININQSLIQEHLVTKAEYQHTFN